jgi:acyl dehydratase
VALNEEYVGRVFPPGDPYEVSRVKIADFADAIGDLSALYRDPAAARAAGHPDVIAPPTFAFAITWPSCQAAITDPGLGLHFSMVVHSDQRFEYARPIQAGDVVTTQTTITSIRNMRGLGLITAQTEIRAASGDLLCTTQSSLVERGADA